MAAQESGAGEAQVTIFAAQGWLALPPVTTATELDWLRGVYDELFATRAGADTGDYFDLAGPPPANGPGDAGTAERLPQIMDPQTRVPELAQTQYFRSARRIAARLLRAGEDELTHFSHMILKPARYGEQTPWHQDEAYWDPAFDYDSVSVWMPLEDATVASGCMQFVPGSHREPVRVHRRIGDDPEGHGLVTDDVDERAAVASPIAAGRATVHHCRMLHYAGPNRTGQPRRAYIHVFATPPRPRAQPYSRPWLGGRRTVSPVRPA